MKKFLAGLVLAIAVSTSTVACSSGPVVYPMPNTMAVNYLGTNYCGYRYDPAELNMYGAAVPNGIYDPITNPYGCHPYLFPPNPGVANSIGAAMFNHLETYDSFYNSGYWYDQYYAPIGSRYHVTLISRVSYINLSNDFNHTYATQIKQKEANAVWHGKSGTIKGNYNFPTSNSRAANKPVTNTGKTTNSGSFGTDNSRSVGKTGSTISRSVSNSRSGRH